MKRNDPLDEDFYIPTPISGSIAISEEEISDLEYFRKKLFEALKKTEERKCLRKH